MSLDNTQLATVIGKHSLLKGVGGIIEILKISLVTVINKKNIIKMEVGN
jgi:hypothetical protein